MALVGSVSRRALIGWVSTAARYRRDSAGPCGRRASQAQFRWTVRRRAEPRSQRSRSVFRS